MTHPKTVYVMAIQGGTSRHGNYGLLVDVKVFTTQEGAENYAKALGFDFPLERQTAVHPDPKHSDLSLEWWPTFLIP